MARRVPEGPPPPPTVQRVRVKYTKSGRLRFTSHRDFARALERALRRAEVPIAFSAGFSPHPKISDIGAAPTGVSSAAEYLELGLAEMVDLDLMRARLDAALPDGLDVVEVVPAGPGSLAERIEASEWRIELAPTPGIVTAVEAFLAQDSVLVERLTKDGRREIDARAAVISLVVSLAPAVSVAAEPIPGGPIPGGRIPAGAGGSTVDDAERAILDLVVRQATPSVRPDDVLAALASLGALLPSEPARASRLAQGPLEPDGTVSDPLATDRAWL
jgi:radical SAM-linked protein